MITPAPTFAPGQRCTIRIVATITRTDELLHSYAVDYLGARFSVPMRSLIERVEKHTALFHLDATIIQPTGRASFLVAYAKQHLRVHVQQIRPAPPEEIEV